MNVSKERENHGEGSDVVAVERVAVPDWASDVLLRESQHADVVVLPQRERDGRGEYSQDELMLVKELRAAGVSADWAHAAPDDRTVFSEYSADVAVFVTVYVAHALADDAVVELAKWLLRRVRQAISGRTDGQPDAQIVVQVDRLVVEGDRRAIEGLKVTGHDEGVVDVIKALLQGGPASK